MGRVRVRRVRVRELRARPGFLKNDYTFAALRACAAFYSVRRRSAAPYGGAASDGMMALGRWGCSERTPLRDGGLGEPMYGFISCAKVQHAVALLAAEKERALGLEPPSGEKRR